MNTGNPATPNKKQYTFEKLDEINIKEQCKALANLENDLKEARIDKRSRLTRQAIKHIENQILDEYRKEKMIKSFTNEDDVKSKLLYETISRTNDAGYFKFINGIKDRMNNVDAILQYSKDPYSYMLHKNRRLLIKLLKIQQRKRRNTVTKLNMQNGRPSLMNREQYDAYFKMKSAAIFGETIQNKLNEKDKVELTKGLAMSDQFSRMNVLKKTFTDKKLVRPRTQTNLTRFREKEQDLVNIHSAVDEIRLQTSINLSNSPASRPRTTFMQTTPSPFNQISHLQLMKKKHSINQPFIELNRELELYHQVPQRLMTMRSTKTKSEGLKLKNATDSQKILRPDQLKQQLSQIQSSCEKLVKKSGLKLQELERQREAVQLMDQKQQKYFNLIGQTLEEDDPQLIEAYYEFKKREDEFAKNEIKHILQDFKVSSLTFQQQIDMAKWDFRHQKKRRKKNTEAVQRMQQELSYKPIN